ncbi:hypothetical protein V8C34DRAFT_296459 [Trichoderma compactum]
MDPSTYNLITHLLLFQPTLVQSSLTLLRSQNCNPVSTLKHKIFCSTGFTLSHKPSDILYVAQSFVPETPPS